MLKQNLTFKLTQKLSPQQIKLMKLIQLPTLDFEQKIKNEIEENPALETGIEEKVSDFENSEDENFSDNNVDNQEIDIDAYLSDDDTPSYKLNSFNYNSEEEDKSMPISSHTSLHENLKNQTNVLILTKKEKIISDFIIGSIDESGYLSRSIDELIDDIAFTQNEIICSKEIKNVLSTIQNLEPPGIASRNLQECLSLQLKRKPKTNDTLIASKIIDEGFDLFSKKHFKKMQEKFNLNQNSLKKGLNEIEKLNPKPGGSISSFSENNHIVPDFVLTVNENHISVNLNRRNAPELHISNNYKEMLKGYQGSKMKSKTQKETIQFIKQKLDAAKWFIEAITQRYQTLTLTIDAIVKFQTEYFLSGDEKKLRPMILKDIAKKTSMDISTVSRVANSKYIETPYGTFLLKKFFSESLKNLEGEEVSSFEIKNILESLIESENKKNPFSDMALSIELSKKGYSLARRTVAKYREQLNFPVARLRKEL
jgi:RNA polymerase sigma-54 factor